MRVVETNSFFALCEADGKSAEVDLSLVGPQTPGTWLLVFLNAAREVLSVDEAEKIRGAHAALRAVLQGGEIDMAQHFADLVDRTPQLPPHLMPTAMETK